MPASIQLDSGQLTPFYVQIVQTIRNDIARGELHAGDALPTVRDLAQQLHVNQNTVGRAYRVLRDEGLVETRASQGTRVARTMNAERLTTVREAELHTLIARLISEGLSRGFTLAEVEAAVVAQRARWHGQIQTPQRANSQPLNHIVGLGSHDLCFELLIAQFQQRHRAMRCQFATVGSLAGLMALARGEAHFAVAHLYDSATDDYNVPFARRLMPDQPLAFITLAHRVQGLMVARGNPKKIRGLRDLTRRGVRFVNRQRGSGTRIRLDDMLRKARIAQRKVRGYAREEKTHIEVAAAIASRTADVGLGIQAAARAFDLDFVPLTSERFELILSRDDKLIPMLLDVIARPEFKKAAQALGGYDLKESGHIRYI